MFRIYDGRKYFYQWDIDRKLIIEDNSIAQVHFANYTSSSALVCEVFEEDGIRVVNVPNVLLQENWDIAVYAYDDNHTRYDASFEVKKRSKPESYVYTETEVLNYNTLLDRVNAVDENIENTVNEYLVANPPEVNLDGYATTEYVDNAVSAIPEPDLSGLATESYVDKAVANVKVDLTGYATEDYVDEAISAIPKTDLSNYYTKAQTDNKYALKSEIPSTSGLATEEYVDSKIANLDIPEAEVDLSNYYTKSEVDSLIPDTSGFVTMAQVEAKGYQTAEQVSTAINTALNAIGIAEEGAY